jgi:hypothetical protein
LTKALVLIFDSVFVESILEGKKTATRRAWKECNLRVGSIQTLMCYYSKYGIFGKARIESISKQKLCDMTEDDARKEGFESLAKFKEYWKRFGDWKPQEEVWVIGFALLQEESQAVVLKNFSLMIASFA